MYSQGAQDLHDIVNKYVGLVSRPVITDACIRDLEEQLRQPDSRPGVLFSRLLQGHHGPKGYTAVSKSEEIRSTAVDAIVLQAQELQHAVAEPSPKEPAALAREIATRCLRRDSVFWFGRGQTKNARKRSQFIEYVALGKSPPGPAVFKQLFADARQQGKKEPFWLDESSARDAREIFEEFNADENNVQKVNFELRPEPGGIITELILDFDTPTPQKV